MVHGVYSILYVSSHFSIIPHHTDITVHHLLRCRSRLFFLLHSSCCSSPPSNYSRFKVRALVLIIDMHIHIIKEPQIRNSRSFISFQVWIHHRCLIPATWLSGHHLCHRRWQDLHHLGPTNSRLRLPHCIDLRLQHRRMEEMIVEVSIPARLHRVVLRRKIRDQIRWGGALWGTRSMIASTSWTFSSNLKVTRGNRKFIFKSAPLSLYHSIYLLA